MSFVVGQLVYVHIDWSPSVDKNELFPGIYVRAVGPEFHHVNVHFEGGSIDQGYNSREIFTEEEHALKRLSA